MNKKINNLGIADILIIGAELLHEFADEDLEAEAKTITRLKSTGKRYSVSIKVEPVDEENVEVAPGIFQSKEDLEANMAFDEERDNNL